MPVAETLDAATAEARARSAAAVGSRSRKQRNEEVAAAVARAKVGRVDARRRDTRCRHCRSQSEECSRRREPGPQAAQ